MAEDLRKITHDIMEWYEEALPALKAMDIPKNQFAQAVLKAWRARQDTIEFMTMPENAERYQPCDGCGAEWKVLWTGGASMTCESHCVTMKMYYDPAFRAKRMEL